MDMHGARLSGMVEQTFVKENGLCEIAALNMNQIRSMQAVVRQCTFICDHIRNEKQTNGEVTAPLAMI